MFLLVTLRNLDRFYSNACKTWIDVLIFTNSVRVEYRVVSWCSFAMGQGYCRICIASSDCSLHHGQMSSVE
jgi:hypothetical protein